MKKIALKTLPLAAMVAVLSLDSCKSRKAAQAYKAPVPVAENVEKKEEPQETVVQNTPAQAPTQEINDSENEKLNFNFKNIQFEFNSAVLKTSSYEVLDQVSVQMKKVPSAKFVINGHSSAEGSPEHNQSLSVDRANSVKTYLVNAGVNGANLSVKGFGESMPITKNDTEAGRALNRRVEIKKGN